MSLSLTNKNNDKVNTTIIKRRLTNIKKYGTNEGIQSDTIKRKSELVKNVNILCKVANKYYLMNPMIRQMKIKKCIKTIIKKNDKKEIEYAIEKIQEKIDIYSQKKGPNPAKIYISTKKLLEEAL